MADGTLTTHLLNCAVERIGGQSRQGQLDMAEMIDDVIASQSHALIQAGTGTGKSLGYLAPIVSFLEEDPEASAVVATATLALQSQLATKDIPSILGAAEDLGLPEISWAVLKGGSNYACLMRIRDAPIDPAETGQYSLEDLEHDEQVDASSPLGKQVVALRRWATEQADADLIADRDSAPRHSPRAWAQVSIPSRECPDNVCPYYGECFVQAARNKARHSQLVVTNHALVAIEAKHGWSTLKPDVLVVDEAHELTSRVTTSQTDELSPQMVDRVVRMVSGFVTDQTADDVRGAAQRFANALENADVGRVMGGAIMDAVLDLFAAIRSTGTALGRNSTDARRERVANAVKEIYEICERIVEAQDHDVVWVSMRPIYGPQLVVAPLNVAGTIRHSILDRQPTVLTSATLMLGDSFLPLARSIGLDEAEEGYTAIDVGSPFDFQAQGICYVASDLPTPGRDQASDESLSEIADLLDAADGHTLGLFSSMRAAQRAAEYVREATGKTVLLQGEGHLPDLIAQFVAEPRSSLFGTISLWQGVDAPGDTCYLVIVDRIPFPRPDEPLMQARQEDVSRHGGNGFMQVAASHAALMLAQGTGRLIRSVNDHGVVAILDSRLLKARYGPYLVKSMPDLWMTTDRTTVLEALRRLSQRSSTQDTPS